MSKEALKLLKEIEWGRVPEFRFCGTCARFENEGHQDDCQLAKAIYLLESQPEPGEFTKEFRNILAMDWNRGLDTRFSSKALEACDLIDRLTTDHAKEIMDLNDKCVKIRKELEAEIEHLTEENKQLKKWPDYFAYEREYNKLKYKYKKQRAEIERLQNLFGRLDTWQKAYPLNVFPKPDLKKAAEVLKASGMTLDAISADNMRHVLDGTKDIVEQALGRNER